MDVSESLMSLMKPLVHLGQSHQAVGKEFRFVQGCPEMLLEPYRRGVQRLSKHGRLTVLPLQESRFATASVNPCHELGQAQAKHTANCGEVRLNDNRQEIPKVVSLTRTVLCYLSLD